uniref:Uncharacterized protein n=1 Tax=Opuntia streptacantha TaxID=393608 RepID=A0A7C9CWF5_OPUST
MASTASLALPLPTSTPILRVRNSVSACLKQVASSPPRTAGRRDCLLLLTSTTALIAVKSPPAAAQDIPLFGLRKKLEQAEKQTEELVKEGFEAAEKGVETAEKGIVAAEKGIEAAEKEIETAAESFGLGAPAQAGLVAGAELLGVVVASSVVKGILGPEPQKQ